MEKFSPEGFLKDVKELAIENPEMDIMEIIHEEIDRAVIYYSDAMEIVYVLNFYSWGDTLSAHEFGEIKNISHLAYIALYDYAVDNLEIPA